MVPIKTLVDSLVEQLLPVYHSRDQALPYAWWILEYVTGKSITSLIAQGSLELSLKEKQALATIIENHVKKHMPLQYIFGTVPFLDLTITVRPPILIPRPETEYWCSVLIEQVKQLNNQAITILDLCTGSGCIALAFAHAFPAAAVYAVDISPQACALAQENKENNKILNVTIFQSDLYSALPPVKFDLIVSNPPYISKEEWSKLDPMVKQWEDPQALIAEHEGLSIITEIISQAPQWLKNNPEFQELGLPQLALEIGHNQGPAVKEILRLNGFKNIHIVSDLAGKDRLVTTQYFS
jgi:release factor glutamine methyltransferase